MAKTARASAGKSKKTASRGTAKKSSRRAASSRQRAGGRGASGSRSRSGRSASRHRTDAISILKQDHQEVRRLLEQLERTTGRGARRREQLLEQLELAIKTHTSIEEEIFYPAFMEAAKKRDDKKMFFEANEEHHVVDMVLPEVMNTSADAEEFPAKVKVLKDLIEHHVREEERDMFPSAKKLFGKEELAALGERLLERKKELQTELAGGRPNGDARRRGMDMEARH